MAYTTIDDPSAYFQTVLWTGNGSARSITLDGNSDMQPDWVWGKNRGNDDNDYLMDSVRGATKRITTNNNQPEGTSTGLLTSFDSDGFSLGTSAGLNASGVTAVGWCWKAGTSFTNDASATGIGTIDSTGSVNTDAGFSIVSYTGNATDNASVKHGLNTAPKMVIIKDLSDTSTWGVWHQSLTNGGYRLTLNSTAAQADDSAFFGGSNRAIPTSSVFFLGSGGGGNGTNANIAYCFSEVKGYSKFGSYTGNGNADGTFVYTGFLPSFVMVKDSSNAGYNWMMYDNKRLGYNGGSRYLIANTIDTEGGSSDNLMDFTSNGFKLRIADQNINRTHTYIYMAFAESPFVTSTGIPTTAR